MVIMDNLAIQSSLHQLYRTLRTRVRTSLFGEHIFLDRVVLYRETDKLIKGLPIGELDALEISGNRWANAGFKSFVSVNYPAFDVCKDLLPGTFDVIIAEQVFEHVLWPHRAAKNVYAMLRRGGYFLVTTPFLQKIHEIPIDCSRWTETGLKYLLADCGFDLQDIQTWSWGNRAAAKGNLHPTEYPAYFRHLSSLKNDPLFPVQVWALARRR